MLRARIHLTACAGALLGAWLVVPVTVLAQDPERTVTIPRTDRAPRLDDFITGGRLEPAPVHGSGTAPDGSPATDGITVDPRGVRIATFLQREPGDGVPASQPTTAYLSYDDANLYVVFVCYDDPARVRANIARREDIGDDDQVVFYLDTFRDRQRAYLFAANPLGIQQDGIRSEATGEEDMSFDAVWSSEGRLAHDGYVVRFAIPFRSLRFPQGDAQTWGIAVGRNIRRANEESYWPPITKRVKGFVRQLGTLDGLASISAGRNMQLNPYSMVARARVFDDDIPGHVTQSDERIGMDGKMVVRDAVTLDATVNPDFSQIETDDPQVTVNQRFEVQFPEKRPFFLDNAGYFETPEQLFFSRRVVDPGVGVRATGKVGRWAMGALAMNDRAALADWEPAAGLDTWIGALRVQRDIGEESSVGVLVSDREFGGSPKHDRMFAADARWRLGDNWQFVGQVMRSDNREHDGARAGDWGARAGMSYSSRTWDYSAGYREFGPDFAAPLGFVNRAGYRRGDADVQYTFRPKGRVVTQYGPSLSGSWLWDHASGELEDREVQASFAVELVASTELEVGRTQLYELFDDLGFELHETQVKAQTEWLRWLGADASVLWGTAVNHDPTALNDSVDFLPFIGRVVEAEIGVKVRPTTQLRLEQSYVHSSMRTPPAVLRTTDPATVYYTQSQRLFTERKWRAKINYQFSRLVSLRAIVDYKWENFNTGLVDEDDPRKREWSADILLTYLVNPGTALYLGITDERENLATVGSPPEVVRSRNPGLSVARQVFVKASYLFRF
jgi:hypothetical protein